MYCQEMSSLMRPISVPSNWSGKAMMWKSLGALEPHLRTHKTILDPGDIGEMEGGNQNRIPDRAKMAFYSTQSDQPQPQLTKILGLASLCSKACLTVT